MRVAVCAVCMADVVMTVRMVMIVRMIVLLRMRGGTVKFSACHLLLDPRVAGRSPVS